MPTQIIEREPASRDSAGMPARIGKYEIVRELGRGACATVFLAREPSTEREVALKYFEFLDTDQATRRYRKTFLNETSLVGKLRHPHIVQLLEAIAETHLNCIVMEYVPGGTLEQYTAADNLLPLDRVVEVIFKVSRALEYAHRQGVIHRDIKPANILVTAAFEVKLSDFGVALLADATHTSIDQAGSPAYMSPEQISGQALTQQSDIYSLGVVFFQLLTGRLPFEASSYSSLIYQILNHEPSPLRTLRPGLPDAMNVIVARALHKDPLKRYRSWAEFGKDLFGSLAHIEAPQEPDTRGFEQLRMLALFRDFREIEIWEALRIASWRSFESGEAIITEGERDDSVYLLVEGGAEVCRAGKPLNALAAGECFGNLLYFMTETRERTTTVRASSKALVIEIGAASLSAASDACQVQFTRAFMRLLVERRDAADRAIAAG